MAGRRRLAQEAETQAPAVAPIATIETAAERTYNESTQLVIAQFGDGLPWSPEHYETAIRTELQRGFASLLRAGRYLLVARECAAHGDWVGLLERLGISRSQAHRLIEAARRVANVPALGHLGDRLGSTKFFDLLALPDEELAALAGGGTVDGLGDADELAGMTSRELKDALRDARETLAAKDERADKRERDIERLQKQLRQARRERDQATPDELAEQLRDECSRAAMAARAALAASGDGVRSVRNAVEALVEHGGPDGIDHGEFLAGLLQELITEVRLVRDAFGLRIIED